MVLVDFLVTETGAIVDVGGVLLSAGAVMAAGTSTASDAESMSGGVSMSSSIVVFAVSLSQTGIGIDVSWGEEGVIFGKEMSCEGLTL